MGLIATLYAYTSTGGYGSIIYGTTIEAHFGSMNAFATASIAGAETSGDSYCLAGIISVHIGKKEVPMPHTSASAVYPLSAAGSYPPAVVYNNITGVTMFIETVNAATTGVLTVLGTD
jgi:hypothetical protein